MHHIINMHNENFHFCPIEINILVTQGKCKLGTYFRNESNCNYNVPACMQISVQQT
jgi:hypothetical protein